MFPKYKWVWNVEHIYIYIYIAVCQKFEPLIYISIWIYRVHCGKVPLENLLPARVIIFVHPVMFSKIKTFPQCTPYMYILIYIKGSKFLQRAVYIYLYPVIAYFVLFFTSLQHHDMISPGTMRWFITLKLKLTMLFEFYHSPAGCRKHVYFSDHFELSKGKVGLSKVEIIELLTTQLINLKILIFWLF